MILTQEEICQFLIIMSLNKTLTKTSRKIQSSLKCQLLRNRNQEKGTKLNSLEETLNFLHIRKD